MKITIYSKKKKLPIKVDNVSGVWEPPMELLVLENVSAKIGGANVDDVFEIEHENVKRKFKIKSIENCGTSEESIVFKFVSE